MGNSPLTLQSGTLTGNGMLRIRNHTTIRIDCGTLMIRHWNDR